MTQKWKRGCSSNDASWLTNDPGTAFEDWHPRGKGIDTQVQQTCASPVHCSMMLYVLVAKQSPHVEPSATACGPKAKLSISTLCCEGNTSGKAFSLLKIISFSAQDKSWQVVGKSWQVVPSKVEPMAIGKSLLATLMAWKVFSMRRTRGQTSAVPCYSCPCIPYLWYCQAGWRENGRYGVTQLLGGDKSWRLAFSDCWPKWPCRWRLDLVCLELGHSPKQTERAFCGEVNVSVSNFQKMSSSWWFLHVTTPKIKTEKPLCWKQRRIQKWIWTAQVWAGVTAGGTHSWSFKRSKNFFC